MSGVKGIIGMHRFNFCLVVVLSFSCRCLVVLLWCENTIRGRPLDIRNFIQLMVKFYFMVQKMFVLTAYVRTICLHGGKSLFGFGNET